MKIRTNALATLAVFVGFGVSVTALWAMNNVPSTVTELPSLPGDTQSTALAINNRGVAAGHSWGADGMMTAVAWPSDTEVIALPPLPGHDRSFGNAINNRNLVGGVSVQVEGLLGSDGVTLCSLNQAMIWDTDKGTSWPLPPLPGDSGAQVFGINNNGVAVGTSYGQPGVNVDPGNPCFVFFTAVKWDRDGNPTPLPTLSPPAPPDFGQLVPESFAEGISENGTVVGGEFLGFGDLPNTPVITGLVWDKDSNASFLDPGIPSFGWGAQLENNNGVAAGAIFEGNFSFREHAAAWDRKGIPSLLPELLGDAQSSAHSINNRGDAVGWSRSPFVEGPGIPPSKRFVDIAVFWGGLGSAIPLIPLPGDEESQALWINDPGEVVGYSEDNDSRPPSRRAVIWR